MTKRAVVIGGGIGGLAAAVALERVGWRADVYEQAHALAEVGAGLMVATNAMRVLDVLGVGGSLRRKCPALEGAWIRGAEGPDLIHVPLGAYSAALGAPTVCAHRADLHGALLAAVPPERVHVGRRFVSLDRDAGGVTARFEDGTEARGTILVGADGIRSAVAEALHGPRPPRYAGYLVWRGLVDGADALVAPGRIHERFGRGARFGTVNIGEGRVYWYATANRPADHDPGAGQKAELEGLFGRFEAPVPALVAATAPEAILRSPCFHRPPTRRWGRGRATLVGDAAHAMTPNLGQGACQAIEDAHALARALREVADPEGALRRFERRRRPRTAAVQVASWLFGVLGQWERPWLRALRDLQIRWTPEWAFRRQYAWLYGGYEAAPLD